MDTQQERLSHLDRALSNGENICSSEGMLCSFPASLKKPFLSSTYKCNFLGADNKQ